MNIYALYVRKGDDLGKLFDPLLCLLSGLERLAEHIENIRGGGCGDQAFCIGFNGLAESMVGGSVKNFVALVKNSSFLVRITDMTILIEKEFIYGSSKRPNPTDYY